MVVSSGIGCEGGLYSSTMRLKEGWWNRACLGWRGREEIEERGLGEGRSWKREYRSSGVSERGKQVGGGEKAIEANSELCTQT